MKKLSVLLLGFLLMGSLAIFAGGQKEEAEKVELDVWEYFSGAHEPHLTSLIEQFNQENPNINVKWTYVPYEETIVKFMTAFAAGNFPEIGIVDNVWVGQMVTADKILPLDSYIDGPDGIDRNDIYDVLWKFDTFNGKTYAVPFDSNNVGLYYNKDLFRKAGLDPKKPPETWDDMTNYSVKLTTGDRIGLGRITGDEMGSFILQPLMWSNGGEFLSKDYTKAAFNSPECLETLEWLIDMIQTKKSAKTCDYATALGDFAGGMLGMYFQGSWLMSELAETAYDFEYGTGMMPKGKKGIATSIGGEHAFICVTTDAKQDASWQVLKHLSSTESNAKFSMPTRYVPIRKSVCDSAEYKQFLADNPNMKTFVDQVQYGRIRPPLEKYPKISDAYREEIEKALYGKISAAEALANGEKKVNEILKEAK